MSEDIEDRLRLVERATAVHEAVCAERYKGITLRLNVLMGLLFILLGAAATGNPLIALIQRALG